MKIAASALVALSAVGVTISSSVSNTRASANTSQEGANNLQTSWYPNEPLLSPSRVTGGDFGELFDTQLTGYIYAQPLISQPTVLAVTEANDAYGINAKRGNITWQRNFGTPADPLLENNCGDIGPGMGITGTPVIDPATDTAYFVSATNGGPGGASEFFMDAVDVQTGATPANWPAGGVPIQGSADGDSGTIFNGQDEFQRPGLVLVNGVVYAAFGSQCDRASWNGWVVGVSEASATITTMWASETEVVDPPAGQPGAGIWQSGSAPIVDSQGNIYIATGNGDEPSGPASGTDASVHNFGEAVVELSTKGGTLKPVDFFIPSDALFLNSEDGDLGSGGPIALPASMGTKQEPNVLLEVGKDGIIYVLNMNDLGGYQQGLNHGDNVPYQTKPEGGVWSKPTVWPGDGGYVYMPTAAYIPTGAKQPVGSLNVFKRVVSASGVVSLKLVGETNNSYNAFNYGSGKPIVTSNGTASGSALLWIVHDFNANGSGAELQAYNPIPRYPGKYATLEDLWSSPTFTASVYSEPGVDNGIIYVGTKDGTLLAFGALTSSKPALKGNNVDFTSTIVSQTTSATATFTATSPTTVRSFTESGQGFSFGAPDDTLPAALSAGQSITVPVTFTPISLGSNAGTLTANVTSGIATVTLNGQGLSATDTLSATPDTLAFKSQPIGGPVVSLPVTLTNISPDAIAITGFSDPALPFAVADPPTVGTLAAGDAVTFNVTFSPPASSGDFAHVFDTVATLDTSVGNFGVAISGTAAPPRPPTAIPGVVTVSFTADSSALSARAEIALAALIQKLRTEASLTVTGYAEGNTALAKSRATAIASFLSSRIPVQLTLKTVTNSVADKATLTTTKQ
jgi:PQQ-like domain